MPDTSFQNLINYATSVSVRQTAVVSHTQARDGTMRSAKRAGNGMRLEVSMPDGIPWSTVRPLVAAATFGDKNTQTQIRFSRSQIDYMFGYLGDQSNTSIVTATHTQGSRLMNVSGGSTSTNYFRAGDVIQLSTVGPIYMVTADVDTSSEDVYLHRPVVETAGTGIYGIGGANVYWNVFCTNFPTYRIFGYDQVSWSGPFVFEEFV